MPDGAMLSNYRVGRSGCSESRALDAGVAKIISCHGVCEELYCHSMNKKEQGKMTLSGQEHPVKGSEAADRHSPHTAFDEQPAFCFLVHARALRVKSVHYRLPAATSSESSL